MDWARRDIIEFAERSEPGTCHSDNDFADIDAYRPINQISSSVGDRRRPRTAGSPDMATEAAMGIALISGCSGR